MFEDFRDSRPESSSVLPSFWVKCESVLLMLDKGMVRMFCSLEYSGLNGFYGELGSITDWGSIRLLKNFRAVGTNPKVQRLSKLVEAMSSIVRELQADQQDMLLDLEKFKASILSNKNSLEDSIRRTQYSLHLDLMMETRDNKKEFSNEVDILSSQIAEVVECLKGCDAKKGEIWSRHEDIQAGTVRGCLSWTGRRYLAGKVRGRPSWYNSLLPKVQGTPSWFTGLELERHEDQAQ
ncbi:pentatricopeptide repeat-containing protein chloroplastic-like [Dorcoceras hygrometricum]|uniref:Pentatricopeptide repeat-containing protein chloroplastic-like n=1 Tax=Dorcoceras hygrometricum TaxID=472368 RepID=A0A2Z7D8W5_9LAMI|nr:pentatricopeptide repeat-containing protein chloroplastic-like [Dorcoceras hygrometricum]